jgi:hypothetical protein
MRVSFGHSGSFLRKREDVGMTDDLNTNTQPVDRVRTPSSMGFGRGPLIAGSVVAGILIPLLLVSGIGAAQALSAPSAANSAHRTEAPPTSGPGDEAPETDPVTPPDRDSDQTGVPPQEDEIYYIQDGDTLTELSARFDMSVDALANYNAVRDVNVISEGAALRVPFIYAPPAPPAG